MQETWVQFLGWEAPLEKRMATHSSILAWRTPWTEEPGRLLGVAKELDMIDWLTLTNYTYVPSLLNLPPTSHPFPHL